MRWANARFGVITWAALLRLDEHRLVQDRERDRRRLLEGLVPFRYAWGEVTVGRGWTTREVAEALDRW